MFYDLTRYFFDKKGKIIIDIKDLNKITKSNNYLLPLQSNIINSIFNYRYIFIVNVIN